MRFQTNIGIEGWFTVELIRRGKTLRYLRFKNLITDTGLNFLGTNTVNNAVQYLGVGSDSTPPDPSQVSLIAPVGARTNSDGGFPTQNINGPAPDYYVGRFFTRLFVEAEANGNLAELGLFSAAGGGTMFCRQLFLDEGVPTTITKTDEDQLRVTYEYRIYPQLVTSEQSAILIDGVPTDISNRAFSADNAFRAMRDFGNWLVGAGARIGESNVLPATTGDAWSMNVAASSQTLEAYVADTFYRDITFVWNAAVGNGFATGVGGFSYGITGTGDYFASAFDPKMNKTDTKKLTIVARTAWARR